MIGFMFPTHVIYCQVLSDRAQSSKTPWANVTNKTYVRGNQFFTAKDADGITDKG